MHNLVEISLGSIVFLLGLIFVAIIASSALNALDKVALGTMLRNLRKSDKDRNISGVCGGLGEHTPVPSWIWRALFLVMLFSGAGLIAYIILAICMPPPAKKD